MTVATDVPSTPPPAPKKKRSIGKIILKLFLVCFVLLIVALVILYFNLNNLIVWGVQRGGKQATEQETILNAADLSLSGGSLQLNSLNIANLKGYTSPNVLTMKSCATVVDSGSLFSHTVIVKSILIDGLEVTVEQNGIQNNLNDLMKIIQKNTAATGSAPTADGQTAPADNTPPGKELKIDSIKLTNTKVHIRMAGPVNFNQDFTLPDLEMTEPTNPDGRPMKIADLIGKILLQVGKQIVENPQIPGDLKANMKNVQALVTNLQGQLEKGLKGIPNVQQLQDLGKGLNTTGLQDAGKNLQDAGKGITDMFNKKK